MLCQPSCGPKQQLLIRWRALPIQSQHRQFVAADRSRRLKRAAVPHQVGDAHIQDRRDPTKIASDLSRASRLPLRDSATGDPHGIRQLFLGQATLLSCDPDTLADGMGIAHRDNLGQKD